MQTALGSELSDILRDQLQFLITGKGPNEYTKLREMILHG
jgi:hypothetical protein